VTQAPVATLLAMEARVGEEEAAPVRAPVRADSSPDAPARSWASSAVGSCARAFLVSRAIVWAAGVAAAWKVDYTVDPINRPTPLGHTANVLAAPGVRWDATWYLEIARHGYTSDLHAVFFPLYPLVVRAVSFVVGSLVVAGLVVSFAAFMAALVVLWRLTAHELGHQAAGRTVWLLALCPASLFFSAAYAESLFLLLSVSSFLSARTGRWRRAALLGAAASATRNTGWLLMFPLALMYWESSRGREPAEPTATGARRLDPSGLWLLVVPLGALAFGIYQWAHFGDPLTGAHAERWWGRTFVGPLRGLQAIAENVGTTFSDLAHGQRLGSDLHQLALLGVFALALVAFAGVVRRLPAAYWLWTAIGLVVAISAPIANYPLWSTPRFLVVLFPLFMWAGAALARPRLYLLVLTGFAVGLAFVSAEFATWHFVS
jgi:mannosyltransferase PIG-V